MRILWLSHLIPYPPKGGVLQRSYNLIRELAKYHEIDLLAFNQPRLIGSLFPSVQKGVEEATEVLGGICQRHRFFEIPSEKQATGRYWLATKSLLTAPYNINWLASPEFSEAIKQWTKEKNYDLIHFDTISLIPFLKDTPPHIATVLDHHNIESHMLLRRAENETNLVKKFYYWQEGTRLQSYEKMYCSKFSLNITCSDIDTARLKEISSACRVQTVPNGVDTDYFQPGQEGNQFKLVFVGRLNWYPNRQAVKFIVENLWPALKQKWPQIEFDLAGSNPPDFAVELGKRDSSFRVHGFVDDVRPIIAKATAYVCPISDGGGTKLKVLDAFAMGKPLVAHPIACEGIEVTPDVNVLFADNVTDYIEHLSKLWSDPLFRQQIASAGRHLAEHRYSFRAIGQATSDLYISLKNRRDQ